MSAKRLSAIADPTSPTYIQETLFSTTPSDVKYNPYPRLVSSAEEIRAIIRKGAEEGMGATDFEFNASRPTIIGVASASEAGAIRWDDQIAHELIDLAERTGTRLAGHSVAGAEREQVKKQLGRETSIELWEDSMVAFHLCHSHLCKMGQKAESDDSGALGLMNLWATASVCTDLPNWKYCRGKYCTGPCPNHSVFSYCAVDAWASLASMRYLIKDMEVKKIPYQFYRECMELSGICVEMEKRGLRVDRKLVVEMEKNVNVTKDFLFPHSLVGGKDTYEQFNPRSTQDVIKYCKENNIPLPSKKNKKTGKETISTDKKDVALTLEKMARREGYEAETLSDLVQVLDSTENSELSRPLDTLLRIYKYKTAGKGTKATFNSKYFTTGDDFLHPRFIQVGTSMGRLASAKPNAQNIDPLCKNAIIPDNDDEDFLESDFSQLELRMVLYLAGIDPVVLGKDAFIWLAENSGGLFTKAANILNCDERQVGKRLAHAGNYGEGFQLIMPKDIDSTRIKKEIDFGARVIYRDWEYCGGVVSFTGANLAQSLFGNKTLENRKKALDLQENVYFGKLGSIRDWHKKVLKEAEGGSITSVTGRYLALYGTDEENAKMTFAFHGQGTSADHVQAVMLKFKRELNVIANMQIHDSLVFSIPKSWDNNKAKSFIGLMQEPTWRLPGFSAPGKIKRGPTYGSIKQI